MPLRTRVLAAEPSERDRQPVSGVIFYWCMRAEWGSQVGPVAATSLGKRVPTTARNGVRSTALVTALAMTCAAGCGATATINRVDGLHYEARIVRSDAGALYLQFDPSAGAGDVARVERASVRDIDHPGKIAMVAGGVFLGALAVAVSSSSFRRELVDGSSGDTSNGARPVTLALGTPGVALLGYGLWRYLASKRAAHAFEDAPAAP